MIEIVVKLDICFECGADKNIHQHHVVPQIRGGTKTIPLCGNCHGKVHGKNFGLEWKRLQMEGIQRAMARGQYGGRKIGTKESVEKFINKPKSKKIMNDLRNGHTIANITSMRNCSSSTVLKVKKLMGRSDIEGMIK